MSIYDTLKKDHVKIKEMMNELVSLGDGDGDRWKELLDQIRDELIPHSRAEESVFYNSLRSIDSAKDVALHGFEEHMEAEALLRSLRGLNKLGADSRKLADKLKRALESHIQEEETRVFNVAQQLFTDNEAEVMAEAFERIKPEVREEGFVQQTLDMVANLMPPRFAAPLRTFTWDAKAANR